MLRVSSIYLTFFFILAIPSQSFADEYSEIKRFCMWKASAAQAIAMNRDIGLKETEVIGHYLKQNSAYNEQLIVLYLVDKIYNTYEFVTHDTIYSQTSKTCLRSFYIDKTRKVFVSQSLNENY